MQESTIGCLVSDTRSHHLKPSRSTSVSSKTDMCTQAAITLTSSGPTFQVHRKVETLVP